MFDATQVLALTAALTAMMFVGIYWLFLDYFGSGDDGDSWMESPTCSLSLNSYYLQRFQFVISNIYIKTLSSDSSTTIPNTSMLPKRRFFSMVSRALDEEIRWNHLQAPQGHQKRRSSSLVLFVYW